MFKILSGYLPRSVTPPDVEMALLAHCEPAASQKITLASLPVEVRIKIYEYALHGADAQRQHQVMRALPELAMAAPATQPYRRHYAPFASGVVAEGRRLANPRADAAVTAAALDYVTAHDFNLWLMLEETKALVPHQDGIMQATHANAVTGETISHYAGRTWHYTSMLGTIPISAGWWMVLTPTVSPLRHTFYGHWLSAVANNVAVSIGVAVGVAGATTLSAATVTAVVMGCKQLPVNVAAYKHRRAMRSIARQSQLTLLEINSAVNARYALVRQRQGTLESQAIAALDNEIAALDTRIAYDFRGIES